MKKMTVQHLTTAAVVGAAYAVLSLFGSVFGVTFGTVQCRFSEALCVLPFFFPETVWGLFAGCLITNLLSPYGLVDIVVGSLATLLGALGTYALRRRHPALAALPPILSNVIIVPLVLAYAYHIDEAIPYMMLTVGAGEVISVGVLGLLFLSALRRTGADRKIERGLTSPGI